jgi:hypothetical protein
MPAIFYGLPALQSKKNRRGRDVPIKSADI